MKKIYLLFCTSLFLLGGITACDDGSWSHDDVYIPDPVVDSDNDDGYSPEPTTKSVIGVQLGEGHTHQEIDGFGCSFGWAESVYTSMQREQIMDDLYGDAGLRLNIYRGEIAPCYMAPDGSYDFGVNRNFHLAPNDPSIVETYYDKYNGETSGHVKVLAQLWLIDYLQKKKINDVYYFFSVWSPPGRWKTGANEDDPLVGGSFNSKFSKDFAKYLVDFVKEYEKKLGINIYGVSGWNEPDQAMGGWAGCAWTYQQMADFVHDDLRPELNSGGFQDTKVIYGELPWWDNAITWVANSLSYKPELADDNIVAAGHGYSTVASNIKPMLAAEKAGVHVWQTETCDDKTRDETWTDAMKWAKNYQGYLMDARTNGIVWWTGARPCTSTGENLIQLEGGIPSTSCYRVDRYYSIGQFSRHIERGSHRVDVKTVSDKANKLPKELTVSAYIKDNNYTIVLVNSSTSKAFDALVEIDGKDFENMISYTSSSSVKWLRKKLNPSLSGKRTVTVPKFSVVTITGKFKEKIQTEE